MLSVIRNLIKRVTSRGNTFDQGASQYVEARYLGKRVTTQVLHDYGFCSSVPDGGIGVCLSPRADETDKAAFYFHPKYRVKDLKPGETVVGNFVVDATLHFDEKGRGVLTLPDDLIIQCKNLNATVKGNAQIDISGSATVNAQSLTTKIDGVADMTAQAFNFNGPINAKNGMSVTGEMKNNDVDVGSAHKHLVGTYKDEENRPIQGQSGDPVQ